MSAEGDDDRVLAALIDDDYGHAGGDAGLGDQVRAVDAFGPQHAAELLTIRIVADGPDE